MKKRLGFLENPIIMVYQGYGNADFLRIQGHVIEDRGITEPETGDSPWSNAKANLKRFITDTFPGFSLKIAVGGQLFTITTDQNGYFESYLPNNGLGEGWHPLTVSPNDGFFDTPATASIQTQVLIPSASNLGIISDIDDTFLISHSTKQLKKLRLMIFKNAHTRKVYEGVTSFYRSLYQDPSTGMPRPLFFVSSSEWNLYDFLSDFCQKAGMPPAVLLLQDMKIRFRELGESGHGDHLHKLDKIRSILFTYPEKRFLLIGDNGQQDPELYLLAAKEHPNQIATVYIRDIRKSKRKRLKQYREKFSELGIDFFTFKKTLEAELNAKSKGYIA